MLLVGHGSHLSAGSALPVHDLADEVRRLRGDLEVRVAFWKEEPALHHAFDLVESREVFVIPIFTSEGYFTDTVLPRELGLSGPTTIRDGRRVRYCPPVGAHSRIGEIVAARAAEAAEELPDELPLGTLVIVGHGTDRHPRSADTTLGLVERVGDTEVGRRFDRVVSAFLDQNPTLDDVLADPTDADGAVVVVPFFIAEGWHAGTTIPRDLGITTSGSGRLRYARAVGTHPLMGEVVLDMVTEAQAGSTDVAPVAPAEASTVWTSVAEEARAAFLAWIRDAGGTGRTFLQTSVWAARDGRFEIRHNDDCEAAPEDLATFEDARDGRAIARETEEGAHRPLSTRPDLRRGWRIVGLDDRDVWEAYAGLYPTSPVHWYLASRGRLPVVGFDEAAGRQTGMYARVRAVPPEAVNELVRHVCGEACLREPWWHDAAGSDTGSATRRSARERRGPAAAVDSPVVPCPEPCSIFLSAAREALDASEGSG